MRIAPWCVPAGLALHCDRSRQPFILFGLTVLGHLLHWLATDMRQDPRVLVYNLEFILHGSVRESLGRFATRTEPGPG